MNSITPNTFATVALLSWPLVALWLYRTAPIGRATLWTILGAQLLLPVGASIKLTEGVPPLDKVSIPALAAMASCILVARRPLRFWSGFGATEILLLMFLFGPFVTSELNGDPTLSGSVLLPGVGAYEALSATVAQFLFLCPFFLGRQFLRSSTDNHEILRILVVAGLAYSVPMLFEIRMSPQLNYWVYGYYASDFVQQMRDGGFRPTVFIGHGLSVAFFAMTATVAAAALWRVRTRIRGLPPGAIVAYLSVVLLLCKSLGALLYGAILTPLVGWTTPRLQLRIGLMLVSIALLYPMLRAENLIPTKSLVDAAASISQERAASLEFRFDQENQLLGRASERILFGWGRFGRSRVFSDYGKDISVTDGRWIITLGQFGLFGFLAEFGLLAFPVFRAASAVKFAASDRDAVLLAALAFMVGVTAFDCIPNAPLSSWTWLMAGALLGRVEALQRTARQLREEGRRLALSPASEGLGPQQNAVRSRLRAP